MKANKIYIPLVAMSLALSACDDQVMEWRESDHTVDPTELPLEIAEILSRYDYLKDYMTEYHPGVKITLGMGLDDFLDNADYRQVVLDNYQGVTFGNAMKHGVLLKANGTCDWTKIDQFLAMNTGLDIHGHNLIWHTQQNQSYLKSLIAPKLVQVQTGGGDGIENILVGDASDFEGGSTGGWGSWGSNKESAEVVSGVGVDGSKALVLTNKGDGNAWEAQCAYTFDVPLEKDVAYKISFKAKSNSPAGALQFQYQNGSTYGSQGGYNTFDVGTDWVTCEYEFTITNYDDVNRILINFGASGGSYTIDDIRFGKYTEPAKDPMDNVLVGDASDFEGGSTGGWGSWGSNKESAEVVSGVGVDGSKALVLTNKGDGNAWEAQCAYTFDVPLEEGVPYIIQFQAKSNVGAGSVQFQYQNSTTYGSQGGYHDFEIGTDWVTCEYEFTIEGKDDVDRIIINYGKIGGAYTIDNIKFGKKTSTGARRASRAANYYYVLKTADEKKQILADAMEAWIKECMEHMGNSVSTWDVINEPIGDDIKFRGIDGGWMSNSDDDDATPDSAPVETVEDGLQLNWRSASGNQHFYWGYYLGIDYARMAFDFARKYSPNGAKLFVNEYNLEFSSAKLNKLIEFIGIIESDGVKRVDGIGTQMHINMNIAKEKVDAMFKTLAATGKLVRITELDVTTGSENPSIEQQQKQAECYNMVLTSYFENVPEAQQSAVTMWTLSDNADEHKYWLSGDTPNLFNAKYGRKYAYKGVCDAIAGFDVGATFKSPNYYKK